MLIILFSSNNILLDTNNSKYIVQILDETSSHTSVNQTTANVMKLTLQTFIFYNRWFCL